MSASADRSMSGVECPVCGSFGLTYHAGSGEVYVAKDDSHVVEALSATGLPDRRPEGESWMPIGPIHAMDATGEVVCDEVARLAHHDSDWESDWAARDLERCPQCLIGVWERGAGLRE